MFLFSFKKCFNQKSLTFNFKFQLNKVFEFKDIVETKNVLKHCFPLIEKGFSFLIEGFLCF